MRKTVLTIAAIIIASVSAFSQSVTETRRIKTTALQIYENYKVVMSGLYSRGTYTEDNFMVLFESEALMYNDILPDNNPQQLSPSEYFRKFQANIMRIYPAFSDFKMGEPESKGNKWQIECNFARKTKFRTQKDMRYPEWSFSYTITIEMDKRYDTDKKVYGNAKIVSVNVENPLTGFFIIENQENMPLVTKSGEILKDWDEEYQSRIFPENKWKIYDIRVHESGKNDNIFTYSKDRFSKNRTDVHFYQPNVQRFKKNIFGIGVNYSPDAFTFGHKMSEANTKNFKDITYINSDAWSLSLFYGKQITHKGKSTVFANIGLDLNKYSHEYDGNNYAECDTVDADKDHYLRKITIDSLNEKINIFSASVPLSVQYLYQLTQTKKPVFLSFELGVFAEYALSSKSTYNINANYRGLYRQYFGVEFEHYLDFGKSDNVPQKKEWDRMFDVGIFGGVGLWFAMNESNLLKFNISYKHSFKPPLGYEENYIISCDKNKASYKSLLRSTEQGMQNIGIGISWVRTIGGK